MKKLVAVVLVVGVMFGLGFAGAKVAEQQFPTGSTSGSSTVAEQQFPTIVTVTQ